MLLDYRTRNLIYIASRIHFCGRVMCYCHLLFLFCGQNSWEFGFFNTQKLYTMWTSKMLKISKMDSPRWVHWKSGATCQKFTTNRRERLIKSRSMIPIHVFSWSREVIYVSTHENRSNSSMRRALSSYRSPYRLFRSCRSVLIEINDRRKVIWRSAERFQPLATQILTKWVRFVPS